MFKNVLAVVAGSLIAMILLVLLVAAVNKIFPLPAGTDMYDAASAAKAMASMPQAALMLILAAYAVAAFVGGLASALFAKRIRRNPSLVTGGIMTVAGLINCSQLHMPTWFVVSNVVIYIPFAFLGYLAVRKKR